MSDFSEPGWCERIVKKVFCYGPLLDFLYSIYRIYISISIQRKITMESTFYPCIQNSSFNVAFYVPPPKNRRHIDGRFFNGNQQARFYSGYPAEIVSRWLEIVSTEHPLEKNDRPSG